MITLNRILMRGRSGFCLLAMIGILAYSAIVHAAEIPSTLEIPVVLSITGPAAFIGNEESKSLQIITSDVNSHGGVQGHPIHFQIQDDQSSPQLGVQIVNGLSSAHVPVILGPAFTPVCAAVAPIVRDNGPVTYCYSPGIHPVAGAYMFSATMSIYDAAIATLRYVRGRGWKRIALLTSTDASGQDFDRGFEIASNLPENRSLQALVHEHLGSTDLTANAQLARIKTAGPDVLLNWTAGTAFGTVLHAVHDVGLDVPVFASSANMIPKQLSLYRSFMPRELLFPGMRGLSRSGVGAGPLQAKQSVYFSAMEITGADISFASQANWDATWLIIDAYRALGVAPTSMQVRDWIRGQHGWIGIQGVYDFRDQEQRGIDYLSAVIDRYDAGSGTFLPVSHLGGVP